MRKTPEHRRDVVASFCDDCVWTSSVRTHFAVLYESGEQRHKLLGEAAKTFFGDLNAILIEYILLQQCKLTDPASSGIGKDNLTTNYILTLDWGHETRRILMKENERLMRFREKLVDARRKLVAHLDLKARLTLASLGSFTEEEERSFWVSLQRFVDAAHSEAIGGPFEIDAAMPDGDAASLIQCLVDVIDYDDMFKEQPGLLRQRIEVKRRYEYA